MPWKPDWTRGYVPAAGREAFDGTIGVLLLDGETVGYVAFSLDQKVSRVGGHLWWRRYSAPIDVVEYVECLYPGTAAQVLEDGTIECSSPWLEPVQQGLWLVDSRKLSNTRVPGEGEVRLTIEFQSGAERDTAWEEYGWG